MAELAKAGVAVWLDDLSRDRIRSGNLQSLVDEYSVVGVTTNPTIFAAAISGSDSYDDQVHAMAVRKVSVEEALRTITAADVRDACDLLAPVAQRTGRDGRFARRLEGCSLAGIARELNERGVPCPSEYDRARNSHRHAGGWSVTTIKGILENPRYTGRQVWNRQAVHHHLDDGTITGGNERERVRNARQDWVISDRPAHPALVTEADFVAVRALEG